MATWSWLDRGEVERVAAEARVRAGLWAYEVATAPVIARRLLGEGAIAVVPGLSTPAYLARVDESRYRIVVRDRLADPNRAIAHELGHWALREIARVPFGGAAEEAAADAIGAAILAPREAVRVAHAAFGDRFRRLAEAFLISQTSAVLRLGEVGLGERAVVTRSGFVFARGGIWSSISPLAAALSRAPVKGVVRARLRGGGDTGRVALLAAG